MNVKYEHDDKITYIEDMIKKNKTDDAVCVNNDTFINFLFLIPLSLDIYNSSSS